jgi:glycosyltransferase involved in cell wall biosynthesis
MNKPAPVPISPVSASQPAISIVVPVYNEEESLVAMHEALCAALDPGGQPWEVIYVDDGSRDRSFEVLRRLANDDARVKVVRFRRNFGQTAAMAAGFEHASGGVVFPIDADLQNDPLDIPRMLAKLDEGFDVVAGWREKRQDAFWTKTLPSRIGNRLIGRVTGVKLHDYGCTLKALQDVHLYGEMHRFLPAFAHLAGARITEMPVRHHARRWGVSKYTLSKTYRVILDLITVRFLAAYATKPIYFFGRFAFASFGIAAASMAWTLVNRFWEHIFVKDQPLFLVGIFFAIAGLQFLLFGLLAEMNMRTYYESQGKPTYFVRERLNVGAPAKRSHRLAES